MPKGQFRKIKGAICNVPIEADTICNILPRGIDSNGLILLKLKRKLCYRGHILFESVRPDIVQTALNYLTLLIPGLLGAPQYRGGGADSPPPT